MLAIRRASTRCRNQGLSLWTAQFCLGKSDIGASFENCTVDSVENQGKPLNGFLPSVRFYSSTSYGKACSFSSRAGAKSSGEEVSDLEDENDDNVLPSSKGELSEEGDFSEDVMSDMESDSDEEEIGEEKRLRKNMPISAMTKAILASLPLPVSTVMEKWLEEGNRVTRDEVSSSLFHLRKRKLFTKALQLSEWLEYGKHLDFTERHYASHVDLIAKVRGVYKAEEYIYNIPKSVRGERVYRTLLANCVSSTNLKKSEEVFNKMKELNIPISGFAYNQLLLLYKKTDNKKITYVLRLMEENNVRPSLFTYQILINLKGQANDIKGMEEVVEKLEAAGIELNSQIRASLARHYAAAGMKDKAEEILKEMEGDDLVKNRWACPSLLPIYASLGRDDEVERIWKACESDPRLFECTAAINAWGQLNRVDKAEAAFEKLLERVVKPSTKHIAVMLQVYADHHMLTKGTDLVKRMSEHGCQIGPQAWDGLVKLYIGAGDVDKAASVIETGIGEKQGRPMFSSFVSVMEKYAEKGEVHNTEKMFLLLKRAGYRAGARQYQILLDAYIKADAPVYGFVDRMRADNIFPNKMLANQLARADAFTKSVMQLL